MEELCAGPLVRAVGPDGAAIWTEWKQPGLVTLLARAEQRPSAPSQTEAAHLVRSRTITVGKRHYALSVLKGLQAGSWYTYRLTRTDEPAEAISSPEMSLPCFRTLDLPGAGRELRLAYGSCRNPSAPGPDVLSAFGSWLRAHRAERDVLWPHLLLLLGDQIYADSPPGHQARNFEEFARMYVSAWTGDEEVRRALATIPSAMMFDDHEITNNWNIVPTWQVQALQQGWEQTLVDGLVAYWIYQGWGNIGLQSSQEHDLLTILQQAADSGEDALEALRARIRQAIYQEKALQWDYTLPTTPPIFVADLRADRSTVLNEEQTDELSPRIMSHAQMTRLQMWAREHATSPLILASSVPALLPPAIGYAEYLTGKRLFSALTTGPGRRLAWFFFARQQRFARKMGFEHWPAFQATWRELLALFGSRTHDLLILSGDVHFSYALAAHASRKSGPAIYQLVSSPFRNVLGARERRLILAQSWLKRAIYGGLSHRMLPLIREQAAQPAPAGMLLQNVIALVSYQPREQEAETYELKQAYMGAVENACVELGSTQFTGKTRKQ